jgi:hypothetical protein
VDGLEDAKLPPEPDAHSDHLRLNDAFRECAWHPAKLEAATHLGVQGLRPEAQGRASEGFGRQGILRLPRGLCR